MKIREAVGTLHIVLSSALMRNHLLSVESRRTLQCFYTAWSPKPQKGPPKNLYKFVSVFSFVNRIHPFPGVGVGSGMKSEFGLEKKVGWVSSQLFRLERALEARSFAVPV